MSFIFKNNDSSRPNLRIGEILDSMVLNDCRWGKTYWDQNGTSGRITGSVTLTTTPRGEVSSFNVSYMSEEAMRRNRYITEGDVAWNNGIVCKFIADTVFGTATQLFMPNLIPTFPGIFSNQDSDEFQGNLRLDTQYYSNSSRLRKANNENIASTYPHASGGSYVRTREDLIKFGGFWSIGFKYWGDVERTLRDVRENGSYVSVEFIPTKETYNGEDYFAGGYLYVSFGVNSGTSRGLFNDASITPENIKHLDDLPDDQSTYPGGGDDSNEYPQDNEDGTNSSGKGTFDNTNDPLDFPSIPLWDATSTGFISMYKPTITEIIQLYGFLWDSDVSTTLKKLFLEPMEAIISLAFFPVDPTTDGRRDVSIGHVDSGVSMEHVQKQFVDFDFGSIKLDEYYGAAWDYSPYTKVSIYLPYIGSQELDVDDVMNADLHLKYRVDLLSGMCVAMLKVTRSRDGLDAVVYTWQGNCAMQVPITAGSAREFINTFIQTGALTGLALVQPAAGALAAKGAGDLSMSADIMAMKSNMINPTMAAYSALNVIGQKVHVQRGGRVDANAGVMSPQSAYIVINRPVSAIPRGWNDYAGYPSLKIKALSTQKGYTQIAYIKLNGLEATAEEISELDGILRGGVYL